MRALDPDTWEPPTQPVSCGNRRDLFKKQRRHSYLHAGTDIRHEFSGEFVEHIILICETCGREAIHNLDWEPPDGNG